MPAVVENRSIRAPLMRVVSLERDTPELAAAYDQVGARQVEQGKTLVAALRLRPGEWVLDVGCGTGHVSAWAAAQVAPAGGVIGIDPLPLRVELAARQHPNFRPRVGRGENLAAFDDASFDVVYLSSVYPALEDPARALAEAFRVLKPGGRIGLDCPDARRPHQSQVLMREAVEEEALLADPARAASPVQPAEALLSAAGFAAIESSEHSFADPVRDANDVIAWSRNNGYGGFLAEFAPGQLGRVRERLENKLDALRTARGIVLRRHLVFVTARKPA